MSRRGYDADNLLANEKLLTAERRPAALAPASEPAPPVKKGKGKEAPQAKEVPNDRRVNLCFRCAPSLKKKLRMAAAERGVLMRDVMIEALKAAGFEE